VHEEEPTAPRLNLTLDDEDETTLLVRYEALGVQRAELTKPAGAFARIEDDRIDEDSVADEPTRVEADLSHLDLEMDLGDELGRGGLARVEGARQRTLRRDVALKSLRPDQRTAEHARTLLSEARILAALEHPAIVPVYMLATDAEGDPVIVMRAIEGRPWRDYVDRLGTLTRPATVPGEPLRWHVHILATVCDAVHHAHQLGVLHRDLKLRNVMITDAGHPYLLDWGLACAVRDDTGLDLPVALDEKKLRGTPGYLAPEMAAVDGTSFGPWTDVYLLGGCLHALLTGWPRHQGRTVIEQLAGAYSSRPATYGHHVPAGLAAIANRACARDPADRYPSAAAMRVALIAWLDGERLARAVAVEREALAGEHASVREVQESLRIEQATVYADQQRVEHERRQNEAEQRRLDKALAALAAEREELQREAARLETRSAGRHRLRRSRLIAVLALCVLFLGTVVAGLVTTVPRSGIGLLLVGELLGGLIAVAALVRE